MHELILTTHSVEETRDFGIFIGKHAEDDLFIALSGTLGAGKTHLVQGIARGLDIDEVVTSPTFNIMNIFEGRLPLKHFDFYRLDREEDLYNIGWDEYSVGGVTVVEWADMFPGLIPKEVIRITMEAESETVRKLTIQWEEQAPQKLVKEIEQYVAGH